MVMISSIYMVSPPPRISRYPDMYLPSGMQSLAEEQVIKMKINSRLLTKVLAMFIGSPLSM